ncbi:MAG: serine/threonine protein kinase [Myxococcales bacterium]|nr:serine/threonine protein kinase [Myxococcales bacterium]
MIDGPSTLAVGDHLGRYRLVRRLGAGGMGEVWAADDPELGRTVALKVLRPGFGDGDRLRREARTMARLDHPNLVPIHDIGVHDGRMYLAMALWSGGDLRTWMTPRRPWREVVTAFIAAGRGLAAAHAAGVIHRDFKPDNVLIDGARVAVTDFGIAADTGGARPHGDDAVTAPAAGDAPDGLEATRATASALAGTPAYMAPERHLGRPGDAAADQFAFCVALWEALYGQRPFRAPTAVADAPTMTSEPLTPAMAVALEIIDGRRASPPPTVPAPAWLRRAIERGLDGDPARRHASMAALVATLERGLGRRRRAALAGAAVATLGAFATVAMWARAAPTQPRCDARDQLTATWTPARAAALTRALIASGRPHAPATATRVNALIDAYLARWVAMRDDACRAARIDRAQSAELLDLRNACLDRRRAELDATVRALSERVDGPVADRAVTAVASLESLDACADPVALRAAAPWPRDPAIRARLDAVRAQVVAARADQRVGRYREARATATAAVTAAAATGFGPAWAEALSVAGDVASDLDDNATARAELADAARRAGEVKDDDLAARASIALYFVVGVALGEFDEARAMEPLVEALVARSGDASARLAFIRHRAGLRMTTGDLDAARTGFEQALALAEAQAAVTRQIDLLGDLANVALLQGRPQDALGLRARARAAIEQTYGADHPAVAANLHGTARALLRLSRPAEAVPMLEQALAIRRRALGDEHHAITDTLNTLGNAQRALGDRAGALARYREALARAERAHDDAARATALTAIGLAEQQAGDWVQGRRHLEQALAVRATLGTVETVAYATTEYNLADGLANHGDCAAAAPLLTHVERLFTGSMRAYPQLTRATCALAAGDLAAAATLAAGVGAACADQCEAALPATADAIVAQVRWLRGDHRGGAAALRAARDALAAIPDAGPTLAGLDAWLAAHRVP